MTAAYMSVMSPTPDQIQDIRCACAASVEMHQTTVENGVARMVGPAPVALPAGQAVVFAPGGRHLMVMGLKAPIRPGQTVTFTLHFKTAGDVKVEFKAPEAGPARDDMGTMPGMAHPHH